MLREYLHRLDAEKVSQWQTMYYVVFMVVAATILVPGVPSQEAYDTMKPALYNLLIFFTFVGPSMTMLGRRLTTIAGSTSMRRYNPAWPGAVLQFTGDGVVWGSATLWFAAILQTDWWTRNLIVVGVMTMCMLGGGMFTIRSVRRIAEIKMQEWREAWARRRRAW